MIGKRIIFTLVGMTLLVIISGLLVGSTIAENSVTIPQAAADNTQ